MESISRKSWIWSILVGSSYTRFPSCQIPRRSACRELGKLNSKMTGYSLRTLGGEAAGTSDVFNCESQADAMQTLTGWIRDVAHGARHAGRAGGVFMQHPGSSYGNAGGWDTYSTLNNSRQVGTVTKNHPKNETFRVWKRTT